MTSRCWWRAVTPTHSPTRPGAYRDAVEPTPAGDISGGCHDAGYWRSQAARVITFLGDNLPD